MTRATADANILWAMALVIVLGLVSKPARAGGPVFPSGAFTGGAPGAGSTWQLELEQLSGPGDVDSVHVALSREFAGVGQVLSVVRGRIPARLTWTVVVRFDVDMPPFNQTGRVGKGSGLEMRILAAKKLSDGFV